MKKQNVVVVGPVESCAAGIVSAYMHKHRADSIGAQVAKSIAELFAAAESDGTFDLVFGNGKLGKENQPGMLKQAIDAKCAKMAKDKRDGIAKMLKVRLSEARKLHRLEGMPQEGEDIQAALKRYNKAAEKAPKPEGNNGKFEIPEEISADALADALSLWMTKQSPAKQKALAEDLKDFLPKPARTRQPKTGT